MHCWLWRSRLKSQERAVKGHFVNAGRDTCCTQEYVIWTMRLTNYEMHFIKEMKVQSNGKKLVQILYVTGITVEPRGPYFKLRELTKKKTILFWHVHSSAQEHWEHRMARGPPGTLKSTPICDLHGLWYPGTALLCSLCLCPVPPPHPF